MQNKHCPMNPESDRENCGADGAVTVSRFRTVCRAFLPWVAAAAMLFGGGLAAQAEPVTPESSQCTVSDKTVTCTGNLSGGVKVNSPDDTYNTLKVNTLNGDIAPEAGTSGINFNTHNEATDTYGNTDITLTVDTGANGITTKGTNARGISARSAGDVTVTVTGKITAKGICHTSDNQECSEGVYARSEDDGDVTVNVTGDIETEGDPDELSGLGTTSSAGIYANSGGGGGDDGDVTVTFRGNIKAKQRSRGIYANSDGAVTVNMKKGSNITTEGISADGILALSNADGDGDVMVTVDGNINTLGERHSNGIAAESRGTGTVTVTVTGNIKTSGESSGGISADSRDDGDVTVTMTGDITTSGEGSDGISADSRDDGDVTVTMTGDITTYGKESDGISADSDGDVTVDLEGDITTTKIKSGGISAFIYDENSAGDIDITVVTGDITTSGEDSEGIYAESYGTGAVTVTMTGDITTSDEDSEGIFAQSYGNGAVKVNFTGDITTSGDNSTGIEAISNDEDSSGTDNPDDSAVVEINVTGDITASGDNSQGIYAEAKGAISITLHGGTITSVQDAGIEISSGATNTLTILGPVTVRGGKMIKLSDGTEQRFDDVLGGSGDETIDNYGTLTTPGTINLISKVPDFVDVPGAQTNVFHNHTGATFNSGTSVVLGSDSDDLFSNAGDLSPGGANAVRTTTLTGNFQNFITNEQNIEEKGTFTVTIDNTRSDRLTVTGTAELGGTVRVRGAYSDSGPYTILSATGLSATGGFTDTFEEVMDTLFIDYGLDYVDSNSDGTDDTVNLTSARKQGVTFREFAGTANQWAVANALDSLTPANAAVGDVMAATTPAGARAAYDARSGEVHASLKGALMDAGQGTVVAVNNRLAARFGSVGAQASTAAFGTSSLADGQSGLWVTGTGASGETEATANTARMETDLRSVVFGIDRALSEGWRLGVLGGYSRTDVSQRARLSSGSVDTWSVGLYGGAEAGASRFSFGAVYDGHAIDARRSVPSIGLPGIQNLSSSYDARSWQLFAEAGHEVQAGGMTLEPFAGVSSITLDTDGFSESGGDTALAASSDTDSTMFATLGLRGAMQVDDMIHLRGMAGWRHGFGDTDPSSTFTMSGSTALTVTGAPTAEDALVAELGIEAELSANAFLGVAYKGRYGDGAAAHGFNAGLRVTF